MTLGDIAPPIQESLVRGRRRTHGRPADYSRVKVQFSYHRILTQQINQQINRLLFEPQHTPSIAVKISDAYAPFADQSALCREFADSPTRPAASRREPAPAPATVARSLPADTAFAARSDPSETSHFLTLR
jgi:hypothetical protein